MLAITRPQKGCSSNRHRIDARRRRSGGDPDERSRERPGARQFSGIRALEILTIEFRVAKGQLAPVDVRLQFSSPAKTLARQRAMHADEILRGRDVVVDERHPIRQRVRRAGCLRPDREMMQEQIVRVARIHQLAVVARHVFQAPIRGLDENVRFDIRPVSARVEHRGLRGRWHRRTRAWPAPDGRPAGVSGSSRRPEGDCSAIARDTDRADDVGSMAMARTGAVVASGQRL